ncbi:MAG: delta(1)-pyrroline-2-carboxylate reductase family protein [Burkholderiales bacterium]|nr:delta(1)-pyrroline-2-carboxylate reductase family protein [Burkholderiales bacterium]ODU70160.1 MAG: ornithine cyclodeaminase [Lautropia sp. SCN 66-9]
MTTPTIICDGTRTASLLDFSEVVAEVEIAARQYRSGLIISPERMVLPLGTSGVLLSMPASAPDIAIHKLVSVQPDNPRRALPTIHGMVTVCDAQTGRPLCVLDGPQVTGRRTAAVSLLAIRTFLSRPPTQVLLIGTGAQAFHHLLAIHALYPDCRVWVRGRSAAAAESFCRAHHQVHAAIEVCAPDRIPAGVEVVITLTTSTTAVYDEPATTGRLVIGVGAFKPDMAELGRHTLAGSDLYADDPAAARSEAGDLLQAKIDWSRVAPLPLAPEHHPDLSRPIVFKSVGTAAWDLAAARAALKRLKLDLPHAAGLERAA